ncbi:ABC transporter substrate-binding protein [Fluviispira multicolorata]|uniref:ABC transporter substrate-binding protein n=1 Tax=Fluviispira multicolorata TaxID=2654512 RepID=A0A833JFU6_9BACT|nr:ABC transporter substrate-binding protein [Fluviispira multicolorata]KAB8031842.1 ABC transporter substrate-binding protein [Fluviispira multicolorata]
MSSVSKCNFFTRGFAMVSGLAFSLNVFAFEARVGIILPLTGSQAYYGKDAKKGIDIALEELQKSDPSIKIYVEDSASSPAESAKAMNKLITSDKVIAVIGEMTSSSTIAAGSIAEKAKIPILTPSATNDTITDNKKYIFRTCFKDNFQGVVMGDFSYTNLSAKTAIILEDADSDYSKGLAENFKATFEEKGGKILKILKFSQKDTTFTSQLGDVRKMKPDVLFIPAFHQQVAVIIREAKDLQIKSKLVGTDGWDTPELRQIAKGAENGGYFSNHYSHESKNPTLQKFIKIYNEKYKTQPSAFSALGYDSMKMIYEAIKNANSPNSEKVRDELSKIKNFDGVTGNISMDKNNNAIKPAVILQFIPNGYKFITSVLPEQKN